MSSPAADAGPTLRTETTGAIAWIVPDSPARMNSFTAAMWAAVPEAVARAVADPAVRAIVVRGAGTSAFSAGADISEFETERAGDRAAHYDRLNHAAFEALINCPKPTIAMIHGYCLGGGLAVALCCDMRFCDAEAQFAIPAAKLGIGYNQRWVRPLLAAVPPARAKEILFTGRRFPATEAHAMGLVNRIVPREELDGFTAKLAEEIASNAPLTIRAAKATIDALSATPEAANSAELDAMIGACFDSTDYAEGRRAFLEKRKPRFEGR